MKVEVEVEVGGSWAAKGPFEVSAILVLPDLVYLAPVLLQSSQTL